MAKVVGKWLGGRIVEIGSGKQVFYIRKRIAGKLYEVSTGATTLKAALAQWERFQGNPEAFQASGAPKGKPLTVAAYQDDYLAWCATEGTSQNWITQKRRYLKWWSKKAPGDVRGYKREALISTLNGTTAPHNRIASLKAFCSWLRDTRGLLTRQEDVTLDIAIPVPTPAQWRGPPRAITREVFTKTLEHIDPAYVDVVTFLGATGAHTTEALRLAKGQGEVTAQSVTIFHKGGRQHRMAVDPEIVEAANRMRARGGFSVSRLMKAIKDACVKAKVDSWAPGALRHSCATWMIGDGASIEAVATYLNHDIQTLKKYYSVAVIPKPMTKPLASTGS